MLIAAKQKQAQDTLISLLRSDVSLQAGKIEALTAKDSVSRLIIASHVSIEGTMNQQRDILQAQITGLNKEVKRWKRKTKWTAAGGLLLAGATAYLLKK